MVSSVSLLLLCSLLALASAQFRDHAPVSRVTYPASSSEDLIDELMKMDKSEIIYVRRNDPESVKVAMEASKRNAAYCRHFCEMMGSFTPFLNASPIIREEVLHDFMKRLFKESVNVTEYCHPVVRFMEMVIRAAEPIRSAYLNIEDETTCSAKPHLPTPTTPATDEHTPEETEELKSETSSESEVIHSEYKHAPYQDDTEVDRAGDIEALSRESILDKIFLKSAMKETKIFPDKEIDEIIAEEDEYPIIGSIRGIPGEHYPNYTDVPITSFSCAEKHIPGFYADLETGCQVFHVCYEHRRESFLCPLGTIFNQPILACDYWYSSNCSLAPMYFDVKVETGTLKYDLDLPLIDDFIIPSSEIEEVENIFGKGSKHIPDISSLVKLLPVKAKVSVFEKDPILKTPDTRPMTPEINVESTADDIFNKLLMGATGVVSKTRDFVEDIPAPSEKFFPIKTDNSVNILGGKMNLVPPLLVKAKVAAKVPIAVPAAKVAPLPLAQTLAIKAALLASGQAKLAIPASKLASKLPSVAAKKASVPVAAKVIAAKASVPVAAKVIAAKASVPVAAKVIAAKASVPVAAKVIAAKASVPVAAKVIAAKASVPVTKSKILAAYPALLKSATLKALPKVKIATPLLMTKAMKSSIPLKTKLSVLPLVKGKIPLAKAKMAMVAISPFTKKALALGYMKLLKAKKLALLG